MTSTLYYSLAFCSVTHRLVIVAPSVVSASVHVTCALNKHTSVPPMYETEGGIIQIRLIHK